MKLDLVKIGSITNLNDLKEYPLDKPYFYNNYLFHYLIITNNINALKMHDFPIYKFDEDNYNGFMLAAKYNNYEILEYLIEKYDKYIENLNKYNESFLHFLDPLLDDYYNFVIKHKDNIKKLFTNYNKEGISPLDILFIRGKMDVIIRIINEIEIDFGDYEKSPHYFNLLLNENLKSKDIIIIFQQLYKIDKHIFSYVDNEGNNILFPIVIKDNLKLLQYINRLNKDNEVIEFDYYTPINTFHIFTVSYNKGLITGNYEIARYIIDEIINNHDFNETDKDGNNFAHFILKKRLAHDDGDSYIEDKILSNYKYWDRVNVDNMSPLDYLKKIKNKEFKKYKPKRLKKNNDNDIKMIKTKYSHGNIFKAHFSDIIIFMEHLDSKYDNLYIPKYNGKYNNKIDDDIILPDNSLSEYNNYPWFIIWNDSDNYFIHPQLNNLINKNKKKYDFAALVVSLRLPNGGLHATSIIYDFKRKMIERYDPYGNTKILDRDMDKVFKKELTRNVNLNYCDTSCYFPVAGFQTLSDENNIYNQKMGDFGGYCLAWTLWYIEHRINNKEVEPKKLVRKTINKILKMKMKPIEYIRNYANYINKYRVAFLKEINIPDNIISNEILPDNYYKSLIDHIKKIYST